MKLDKALAISAYAVQAFATLALVFIVSHLLSGAEYGHYSLVVASAQSAAVVGFEWIRLAATRFCADVHSPEAPVRKDTVQASFIGAVGVMAVLALGGLALGLMSLADIGLGLLMAVLIGITDLLLVFLRVQGSFNQFAGLQVARAAVLLIGSVLGAHWGESSLSALVGLCAGYGFTLLIFVFAAPKWWVWSKHRVDQKLFRAMASYGAAAAAASNVHLQVPLLIRWVGTAVLPAEGFAGLSLAMDILQKPFALVTSAIGGVLSPGVILEFDKRDETQASPKLRQLYEVQLWCVLLMLGGAIGFLPDLCALAVKPNLRDSVLHFGAPIAVIFAAHTLIQTTISIPGHLLQLGRRLIFNAVAELACVAALMCPVLWTLALRPDAWLWLGALGACAGIGIALPLVRTVPCAPMTRSIFVGMAVCLALAALREAPTQDSIYLMAAKAGVATLGLATGLLVYRRRT